MSENSPVYNRFDAIAKHLPPYEFHEYPKVLYKGEGKERTSITVEDAGQEEYFAAEGYSMLVPPEIKKITIPAKAAAPPKVPEMPKPQKAASSLPIV